MPARFGSNKDPFLAAYRATGNVGEAAAAVQMHRSMHYRRLREDPQYKKAFDHLRAEMKSQKPSRELGSTARLRYEVRSLRDRVNKLARELHRATRRLDAKTSESRPTRAQPPIEADPFLDQIARGMAKRPFSKLSPAHQAAVLNIAERIRENQPN